MSCLTAVISAPLSLWLSKGGFFSPVRWASWPDDDDDGDDRGGDDDDGDDGGGDDNDGDDEDGQEKCSQSDIRLSVFLCMVYFFEDSFVRCRSHDLMRLEASGNRNLARFR